MTFIDLGAYDGDTVREFLADHPKATVYAFEPNPNLGAAWLGATPSNVHFYPWAAWTANVTREFAVDATTDSPMGSTLIPEKRELWALATKVQVKCFDFSSWLKKLKFTKPLIVKMDIEGAEFPVLEKMIADGTDELIDELRVEWHQGKIDGKSTDDVNGLKRRLRCRVVDWS